MTRRHGTTQSLCGAALALAPVPRFAFALELPFGVAAAVVLFAGFGLFVGAAASPPCGASRLGPKHAMHLAKTRHGTTRRDAAAAHNPLAAAAAATVGNFYCATRVGSGRGRARVDRGALGD